MSVHRLSDGLYEIRWREGGRNKSLAVHGGFELATKILRKKMSSRDENRHLDVKREVNFRMSELIDRYITLGDGFSFPCNQNAAGVFAEWEKQSRSFDGMAISGHASYNLSGTQGQLPEMVQAATFSSSMLPVLGVEPALGRNLSATDDNPSANGTALLNWSLWRRRFGGNPSIVGQTE